jgi:hypothetical protein
MRRAKNLNKRDTYRDYFRRQTVGILRRAMAAVARDLVAEMLKKFPHGFKGGIGGTVTGSVLPNSWQSSGLMAGCVSNEYMLQLTTGQRKNCDLATSQE